MTEAKMSNLLTQNSGCLFTPRCVAATKKVKKNVQLHEIMNNIKDITLIRPWDSIKALFIGDFSYFSSGSSLKISLRFSSLNEGWRDQEMSKKGKRSKRFSVVWIFDLIGKQKEKRITKNGHVQLFVFFPVVPQRTKLPCLLYKNKVFIKLYNPVLSSLLVIIILLVLGCIIY